MNRLDAFLIGVSLGIAMMAAAAQPDVRRAQVMTRDLSESLTECRESVRVASCCCDATCEEIGRGQ